MGNKHTTREGEREIKASNRASKRGRFCGVIKDVTQAAHEDTVEPTSTRGLKSGWSQNQQTRQSCCNLQKHSCWNSKKEKQLSAAITLAKHSIRKAGMANKRRRAPLLVFLETSWNGIHQQPTSVGASAREAFISHWIKSCNLLLGHHNWLYLFHHFIIRHQEWGSCSGDGRAWRLRAQEGNAYLLQFFRRRRHVL